MKRIYTLKTVLITTVIFTFGLYQSNAQVGIGNTNPQGALDISTLANPNADGLLIPRVALALTTTATVLTPTVSEMIYNTATAGDVTPGFYYWDGAKWVRIVTGTTSNDWTTTGNATTTAATNFVGTTDAIDFVTRTNNTEKTRVTSAGNVGIGTPTPAAKLDVLAGITTTNSIVNATGSINDFLQYNIQNTSTGIQAQSGYSATADNGTATSGFAWLGINNSAFNFPSTYNIGIANDVSYIGSGQDMHIANANNTKSIIFSTGKTTTPFFDERMRITNAGNVGIGTPAPDTSALLDVSSTNKGVSFPNINLLSETDAATIATPKVGLMVYNTNTTLPCGKGLYFNNGTAVAPVWSCFSKTTRQLHAYDTAGRVAVTSAVNTLQPGCTINFTIPSGQIADIKIDAVLGGTNTVTTAGIYNTFDTIVFVDGAFLPQGGFNRTSIVNSSAGGNAFGSSTLSTIWSGVIAGAHTIQLFSSRSGGSGGSSVTLGGNCTTASNCGEINAIITYR
ncbi:hypothetical protein [Flavobacterium sp.]|uniref:hypothetical protein n=1 Tax=Flavobacterium sp. TaxID=239 RepID=UPI00286A6C22|nr:hypothetical protein [Flavobacterium sp.]